MPGKKKKSEISRDYAVTVNGSIDQDDLSLFDALQVAQEIIADDGDNEVVKVWENVPINIEREVKVTVKVER